MKDHSILNSGVLALCLLASQLAAVSVPSKSYQWADPADASNPEPSSHMILKGQSTFLEYLKIRTTTVPAGTEAYQERMLPDTEQLIIVRKGKLTIIIQGEKYILSPNSIALILPGEVHQIRNLSDEPLIYFEMSYRSKLAMNSVRGEKEGGSFVVDFEDLEFKPHDKGGRWNNFNRPTAMTENFEMHITTLNEGITSHPPHTHTAEEIILMIHGEAEELINGVPHALTTGDFAFLDSMVPHGIRNTGKGTCMYFAFQWR